MKNNSEYSKEEYNNKLTKVWATQAAWNYCSGEQKNCDFDLQP
jgi:hypothetical protein